MRKQNLEYLAREQEIIRQELANKRLNASQNTIQSGTLKSKWKIDPDGKQVYTREKLLSIFKKYGEISTLIVSKGKSKGSAIIEYYDKKDAEVAILVEKGYEKCPLKLAWVHGVNQSIPIPTFQKQTPAATVPVVSQPSASYEDYEAKVLQMMLQVAAKKRKMPDPVTMTTKHLKENV